MRRRIAQSNVLQLSFRSYNPDVAADVLRALISGYLERRVAVFAQPAVGNGAIRSEYVSRSGCMRPRRRPVALCR